MLAIARRDIPLYSSTKVMYTPPIGQVDAEPNITVEGNRLGVVDSFVYLGSTLSRNGSLDIEISRRIAKASMLLVNWRNEYGLIAVLQQIPNSVYMRLVSLQSCYMDLRRGQVNLLERFHQNCIRRILNIEWRSYTPDSVVLQRASSASIET